MSKTLLFSALLLTLAIPSAIGQTVKVTSDKTTNPLSYATFRIDKGELVTIGDRKIDEQKFYDHFRKVVTEELELRGYRAVVDSAADLVISYMGQGTMRLDVENVGPLGQAPVTDPSGVSAPRNWSREYREGSLIIDIVDPKSKKTVWRSSSTMDISAVEDEKVVNGIIFKTFKKYPAKSGKKKK